MEHGRERFPFRAQPHKSCLQEGHQGPQQPRFKQQRKCHNHRLRKRCRGCSPPDVHSEGENFQKLKQLQHCRLPSTQCMDMAGQGVDGGQLRSGVAEKIFLPYRGPQRPQVLVLDQHHSHEAYSMLKLAIEQDIHILALPPHTSHWLQPLDKGCFSALSRYYRSICSQFMSSSRSHVVNKATFTRLFSQAWERGMTQTNVRSGFRVTGIVPFNPEAIPETAYTSINTSTPTTTPISQLLGSTTSTITQLPASTTTTTITQQPVSTTTTTITQQPISTTTTTITQQPISTTTTTITQQPISTTTTTITQQPISTTTTTITQQLISTTTTTITQQPISTTTTTITQQPISTTTTTITQQPISTTTTTITQDSMPASATSSVPLLPLPTPPCNLQ